MICMIVLSHFEFMIRYSYGPSYTWYLVHPTLAVDFFFMLSGFGLFMFMEKNALDYSLSISDLYMFARQKINRIYAPYLFSLILSLPFTIMDKTYRHSLAYAIIWTIILFIIAITLFQSAFGMSAVSHAVNGIGWFLSSLFISYMAFPPIHRLIKKLRSKKYIICSILGCIALIEAIFLLFRNLETALSPFLGGHIDDLSYGSPYFRVFFLILGALIAKLYLMDENKKSRFFAISEPFVIIMALIWFVMGNTISEHIPVFASRLIDIVLCSLIVYVFAAGQGFISGILKAPAFVRLGDLSMFIFLFHYPVRMAVDIYFSHYPFVFGDMTGIIEIGIILVLTFLMILIYKQLIVRLLLSFR